MSAQLNVTILSRQQGGEDLDSWILDREWNRVHTLLLQIAHYFTVNMLLTKLRWGRENDRKDFDIIVQKSK